MDTVNQETGTELNSIEDAAKAIRGMLEPEGQPEHESEEVEAEETEEVEETEESDTETEPEESSEESTEADEEGLELSTLSSLAEQLGVKEEDLLGLRLTEKVNGEEREVTLADLRKEHMMDADYRRKTTELAESRKAFEAQQQQAETEYASRLNQAGALIGMAEQQLMDAYKETDWNKLRQEDPTEFLIQQQDYNNRYAAIQQAKHEVLTQFEQGRNESAKKRSDTWKEILSKESEALRVKLPEWADEGKAKAEQSALMSYLVSQGYKPEEISIKVDETGLITHPGVTDHKAIILARKAMLYDQMQQKKPELKKKIAKIPKVQKPGAAKSKQDIAQERSKQSMAKLRKTGDYRDAALVLRDLL